MQMSTTSRPRIKSQAVIDKCQVEIVDLKGTYIRSAGTKSAEILDGSELCRVEEFAARHFRRSGFEATFLESAPLHVLFGVYFWSLMQDRCDSRVRIVGILDRQAYDQHRPSEVIWIRLPSDFGTADYARRRAKAITKHLAAIAETSAELLRLFDNWLAPSVGLRQYLWAHRRESIETARKLIELTSPVVLKTVLGYLVLNYWGHRSGWPDLLVYRANQWFLAEVKSCSDKLNENQKRWIEDNHRYLHLPFKLVQVHRMEANVSASAVRSWAGPRDRVGGQRCEDDIGRVRAGNVEQR
jgi:VRR-NUC domain